MLNKNRTIRLTPAVIVITVLCCIMLLALVFLLISSLRSAPASSPGKGLTLQVSAGFDGRYKDGTWIPVHVVLSNSDVDFTGTLSISPPSPHTFSGNASTLYQSKIALPTGAQKQITLYIPFSLGSPGTLQNLDVQLLDTHGHVVQTQPTFVRALETGDIFVGLLSDQPSSFNALSSVELPNQAATVVTEALNASNFPTAAAVLDNFDMLVLDNFTTSSLNSDQINTLAAWIQRGGALVEVGGPSWYRTLGPLTDSLLPVNVTDTTTLLSGFSLLPISGPPATTGRSAISQLHTPVLISTATITPGPSLSTTLLATGDTPLLVERQQGHGLIYYLAFDPTLEPLASWSGTHLLWQNLLLRILGGQLFTPNMGAPVLPANGSAISSPSPSIPLIGISMNNLLRAMLPHALPLPWSLIALLAGYPLMLGPVRFLLMRKLKRRGNWHFVLTIFVVFSSLAYGLALHDKDMAISTASISILQFNQDGAPVHVTTYSSLFLPDQRNAQVTVGGNSLVQTLPKMVLAGDLLAQQATIIGNLNGTQINLNGEKTWTTHTVVSEQDRQINGNIVSHLTLDHTMLRGTLTNKLPYSLTDTYILTTKGYIHSGPLAAGQTHELQNPFNRLADGNTTLADQIAADNALPTPYDLNQDPQKAKTRQQQHIAMLAALSGELSAFTCGINVCSLKNSMTQAQKPFADPVILSNAGGDPLLLSNTPATLIGWTNQETDSANTLSINGTTGGIHEFLVQVPLSVRLPDTLYLPSSTLTAQLVDVQGNNIQTQPGLYLMTTGSMTFELAISQAINVEKQPLTISLMPYPPDGIYQLGGSGARLVADGQHVQVSLYNWYTNSWETTSLHQYMLTTNQQAYVGPGQRILLKLNNQDASQGTFIFGTPMVNL